MFERVGFSGFRAQSKVSLKVVAVVVERSRASSLDAHHRGGPRFGYRTWHFFFKLQEEDEKFNLTKSNNSRNKSISIANWLGVCASNARAGSQ